MDEEGAAAKEIVGALTGDEQLWLLDGDVPFWAGLGDLGRGGYHRLPFPSGVVEETGRPGFAFADGPRGVVVDRATCFPVSMARGAAWDVDLEERIGEAIGRELRAVGADLYGGVCVNILRHPAWGRAQETYGEDPHHVGELGAALTRGVQRHAMACVKHFACNSMENARFSVDITVDEVALHEVYLPHFKRIVDEGVAVVMSAYNSLNGECCGDNRTLLTEILREEWGFRGFVISDFIFGLRDAGQSLVAGLDVEMPFRMVRATHLRDALDEGAASWDDVEAAARNVVATQLRFRPVLDAPAAGREVLACAEHRALAREAAGASVVLRRNEPVDGAPVLPLDPVALRSLAVVGRLAAAVNLGDAGSSDVWAPEVVTPLDGLRAALPDAEVSFDDGSESDAAAGAAGGSDAALVVVGYTYLDEGEFIGDTPHLTHLFPGPDDPELVAAFEAQTAAVPDIEGPAHVKARPTGGGFGTGGDRESLRLAGTDVELIRAVAAANPRTVVAIVAGSAVLVSEWAEAVPAVVQSWYSGMEGGHGLADVLTGRVEPRGRLPFSVPTDEAHLPAWDRDATEFTYDRWHGWWHLARQGTPPAYPFGFGLAYTTFALDGAAATAADGVLRVATAVCNTGERPGSEVVQVYGRRAESDGPPRLLGFRRVDVPAGDRVEVTVDVLLNRLAERDAEAHAMVVRPGAYELRIARHAADPGLPAAIDISEEATA
ncbi:glycoside hydrolase family 3 N-terminal domain-containing protein [soil metagenome]